MTRTVRSLVAPAYLVGCICLGGSVQSVWGTFALQVVGVAILVWAAISRRSDGAPERARVPAALLFGGLLLVLLQLIPLPPAIWTSLPGRGQIAAEFALLHWPMPWLPVSEAPFATAATVLALIPPLAMIAAVKLGARDRSLAFALLAGTAVSILLGAVQVASGGQSGWYLYPFTNDGAVGFFANRNHMATLLLSAIPFAVTLPLTGAATSEPGRRVAGLFLAAVVVLVILVGIVLNGSLAALLLVAPVVLASLLLFPMGWRLRWIAGPLALLGLIAALVALTLRPVQSALPATGGAQVSVSSREAIWSTTLKAIEDSSPVGTGLGTFESVYPQYENPHSVDSVYINHAHNDYIELALELGWAGILLLILFLGWWANLAVKVWTSNASSPMSKAATITSAAILAHSTVDFPLRTSAMAAVFAMCLGLMITSEGGRRSGRLSRRARHVTIG